MAEHLQQLTDGTLYEITLEEPYSGDSNKVSDRVFEERDDGEMPALSGELPDISEYDQILIGTPVWNDSMSNPIASYLEQTDFDGKTVAPFHNEVTGIHGLMWKRYAAMYPEYIKAADCIAGSGIPYTLIRTADLTESDKKTYHLHKAGEKAHSRYVSRTAVAMLICKIILAEDNYGMNESIGITD